MKNFPDHLKVLFLELYRTESHADVTLLSTDEVEFQDLQCWNIFAQISKISAMFVTMGRGAIVFDNSFPSLSYFTTS